MLPASTFCARLLCALALGLPLALPLQAAPAAPPIEAFFASPALSDAALSPSGRYLAAITGAPGKRDKLMVIDLEQGEARQAAGSDNLDILGFEWVNDGRLLFTVRDKQAGLGKGNLRGGLYAVNRDGSSLRQLATRRAKPGADERNVLPSHTYLSGLRGKQDSDEAWVLNVDPAYTDRLQTTELLRLDTVTGRTQSIPRPGPVDTWLLDDAGEPRLAVHTFGRKTSIHYLDPASGKWRLVNETTLDAGGTNAIVPLGFGADGTLYVRAHAGKDTAALHTLDLATGKLGAQPVAVLPGYDFDGKLVSRRGKLLGVEIETDAPAIVWFDKDMQAVQAAVDKLLPGSVNLLSVASSPNAPWVLVRSFSDTQPAVYRLYQHATGKLKPVGNSREGIDPAAMGRQDPVRYSARDGRQIPALLTLPAGGAGKNLPLLVLVHDWPYSRGNHWGWNPERQFLASRGYAVLEPDYRGSTGYGQAHFRAGWKQWGLAMQDDLADAVRWAVAQGIADPKRVCIAGGGYGGYATLVGLARDPALYRCGIAWGAITDTRALFNKRGDFILESLQDRQAHGVSELVGDAGRLQESAPLELAARIAQPVLLAHGADDRYVPYYDGTRMRDLLQKTNASVEWAEYPDEDHDWATARTRIDFWSRVERFLGRHIGAGAAPR